jgi:hypothetical protein
MSDSMFPVWETAWLIDGGKTLSSKSRLSVDTYSFFVKDDFTFNPGLYQMQ